MLSRALIFRQLFDRTSCTYTYLLADAATRAALLIDPVLECAERDVSLVNELGLKLHYVMNTHVHADHITGSGRIKQLFNDVKSIISKESGAKADLHITENDRITLGSIELKAMHTPGHTNGCMSYVEERNGLVFTGDALLIRGCGRTDFQNGSASLLYDSVQSKLFTLPDHFLVFPAHDYKGQTCSTIGEEKRLNPRLSKSKAEFIEIMQNLNLDKPKLIDIAVPKNMICGC